MVHAPSPHNEYICHATNERRQAVINDLKALILKADHSPCVMPTKEPQKAKLNDYTKYSIKNRKPEYVLPLITEHGVVEIRPTTSTDINEDDPNVIYKKIYCLPNMMPNTKEVIGGVTYETCDCIKRNGLQDQCPRSACGGRPECLAVNPGPCCEPAMAMRENVNRPQEPNIDVNELCRRQNNVIVCCCCHR